MDDKTIIALKNYDWMVRNHSLDDVVIDWNSETLVYGDGGADLDSSLGLEGFTPATSAP